MTKKTFLICRIITVFIVAMAVSISVNYGNWYLPIAFLITAWVFLYVSRTKVKEVVADERDYRIAGKASGLAMRAYSVLAVISGLILYIVEKDNEVLFAVGSTLLYSAGFLMVVYAILFKIYDKKNE